MKSFLYSPGSSSTKNGGDGPTSEPCQLFVVAEPRQPRPGGEVTMPVPRQFSGVGKVGDRAIPRLLIVAVGDVSRVVALTCWCCCVGCRFMVFLVSNFRANRDGFSRTITFGGLPRRPATLGQSAALESPELRQAMVLVRNPLLLFFARFDDVFFLSLVPSIVRRNWSYIRGCA